MTGNLTDAATALSGIAPVYSYEGGDRLVYLINGVIYKVCRTFNDYPNRCELYNFNNAPFVDGIRYPATEGYRIGDRLVIAMEWIDGEPVGECWCIPGGECDYHCLSDNILDKLAKAGMTDRCYGNIIRVNDQYYIVDFGE